MDVREKLVELVDKARRYAANKCHSFMSCAECDHYGEHDGNCRNAYIVESLIADGVTVQKWIATDERTPTKDDAMEGYVAVAYVWGDGVTTKAISLVDVIVAHPDLYDYWMPLNLPQPPKGE